MFEDVAKLIGKLFLSIFLIYGGITTLVAGFRADYLVRDHSDSVRTAAGGERLSTGGKARPGDQIYRSGYVITPLVNIVLGFVLPVLGLYLVKSSASDLWALRKTRKIEPEPSSKPLAVAPAPAKRYLVRLIDCRADRIAAIKVRDIKGTGLSDAAQMIEHLPATIASGLDFWTAEKLLKRFTDAGVNAEIVENPT